MSANTAELTLIIKAKNLADAELAKVKEAIGGLATKASAVADKMALAFKGIGRKIGTAMGNIAQDVLSGGSIEKDVIYIGTVMAGAVVEGLIAALVPGILAKLASTTLFAPVATAIAAEGATLGSILSASLATAASVGLAIALPILAVWVGKQFANMLPAELKGPGGLGMSESQRRILDARYIHPSQADHEKKASGGWVGLHGPQLVLTGERGPEYVRRAGTGTGDGGGGMSGVRILGVSEQQILDMVDRGLYFRLQRAAPTPQRT